MFPLSIAGKVAFSMEQLDTFPAELAKPAESCDPGGVTCRCGTKCGLPLSFYEPARHYDVTKTPGCLVGLGTEIPMSDLPGGGKGMSSPKIGSGGNYKSFNHVNVYVDPLLYWLDILTDNPCIEQKGFDLLYFTPADICWTDESMCSFLQPESFLFGSMPAIAACAADATLQTGMQYFDAPDPASQYFIQSTYWCVGSQGNTFPLTGFNEYSPGRDLADAMLTGQRMFNKLHRELLVWGTSGTSGLCGYYPKPMMDKLDYKVQLLFPRPQTEKIFSRCCQMFGVSTTLWGSGKSWPVTGEDYSFMVFRRRDCCTGTVDITQVSTQ